MGLLLSFCLIFYFVYSFFVSDKSFDANIILDGNKFFKYKNNSYENLISMEAIGKSEFKIYSSNTYIDNYIVSESNKKFYFFDKDYNSYDIGSPFLAISVDSSLMPLEYSKIEFESEDMNIINDYLKSININYNGEYNTKDKYLVDLDNDGSNDDYIYILDNELYSNDIFYIIFARVGNKSITINKQIDVSNIEKYELGWIFNVGNDGFNDIILKKMYVESYEYFLYRYSEKNGYMLYS